MSWVVIEKSTGKAALETFEGRTAQLINKHSETHEAIPAGEYLAELNEKIRKAEQ